MVTKHVYIISLIYTRLCICVMLIVAINLRFLFICGLIVFMHVRRTGEFEIGFKMDAYMF